MKHLKHHETVIIRCDDIGARCGDVGDRAEVIRCDDIDARCGDVVARGGDVDDRAELPAILPRSFRRYLRSWYNSADV